ITYPRAVALLGATEVTLIDDTVDALAASDGATLFRTVDKVVESGLDPRRFATDLLQRLRDLIMVQSVPQAIERGLVEAPVEQAETMHRQAEKIGPGTLARCADMVHEGMASMRGATSPRLLLEILCAKLLLPSADNSMEALLQRVESLESGTARPAAAAPGPGGQAPGPAGGAAAPQQTGQAPPSGGPSSCRPRRGRRRPLGPRRPLILPLPPSPRCRLGPRLPRRPPAPLPPVLRKLLPRQRRTPRQRLRPRQPRRPRQRRRRRLRQPRHPTRPPRLTPRRHPPRPNPRRPLLKSRGRPQKQRLRRPRRRANPRRCRRSPRPRPMPHRPTPGTRPPARRPPPHRRPRTGRMPRLRRRRRRR